VSRGDRMSLEIDMTLDTTDFQRIVTKE
jgi:hypothetical protein